ncbi:unnamed protein product, partial [Rotaria magnacalcarata]
ILGRFSPNVNSLVVKLCKPPKARATAVQPKQMTLNGILKSGVGRLTSNDSEYSRTKPSDAADDKLD